MRRARGLLVAGALLIALAGCTQTPPVRAGLPGVGSPASEPDPAGAAASSPALAAQKQAAGLPDCPVSDAAVAPVVDGLPDLVLPCLGGGRATRLAGLRGTPMVINVWAQWCGPCRTEAPMLAEVSRQAGDRLVILGVDYNDPHPDLALDFAAASGWTYPQLFDQDRTLTAALGLPAAPPQTLLVRADGTVAHTQIGELRSADDLRAQIAEHLGVRL